MGYMESRPSTEERSTLSRRRLLGFGGVVGLSFLSGCTRDVVEEFPKNSKWPVTELLPDLPVHERRDVLDERITVMASKDIGTLEEFTSAIEETAIEAKSVEEVRDVLSLEYTTTVRSDAGHLHDIATTAGAYAPLVESGYDAYALAITIIPTDQSSFGVATVETKFAKRFNAGELTAREYGELVSDTLESKRTPPEVGVKPDE